MNRLLWGSQFGPDTATARDISKARIESTAELCDALATAIDALESIADEYHAADLPNNEVGVRAHVLELHFLQAALLRARVLKASGGGI